MALFKKLISGVNNDDSKLILDSCNSSNLFNCIYFILVLQSLPDDQDAQKCRIVCYINLEKVSIFDFSCYSISMTKH